MISVVTVAYQNSSGLKRTLESIWSQHEPPEQIVVIDGGSKDGSYEYLRLNSARIDYWVSESDCGIYDAMNKGVSQACEDFVIFMNAGDVFVDNWVLNDVKATINSDSQFAKNIPCSVYFGRALVEGPLESWQYPSQRFTHSRIDKFLKGFDNMPNHQAMFFPQCFYQHNRYIQSLSIIGDLEYKIRAWKSCQFRFIERIICRFELTGVSSVPTRRRTLKLIVEGVELSRIHYNGLDRYWFITRFAVKHFVRLIVSGKRKTLLKFIRSYKNRNPKDRMIK